MLESFVGRGLPLVALSADFMAWRNTAPHPKSLILVKGVNSVLQMEKGCDVIRLLIVDDHPLVRSGIRALIDMEDDLEVCGEAEDQHDAMEMIKQDQPDLVLVDISLKNSNGLNLLKEIGQILGVTESRVSQILTRAIERLRKKLKAEE